ncbi:hypothetical protein PLESTB_000752300 [Pleodorina starrii]|uniref:Uncharacterized protein n=1 Tax=Pleodorina starrii TaxID=330485 RepID=A0A9W6F2K2_9CHLO|nr:hypothetical protein PLESTM_001567600 [Pleodorina starrii]GLC53460.1 hypothetical protein PLESTB_000752300 [Pleodorina starrii]GLC69807.1 hypothetical protein PLESTF_000882600 [Pleodorina starrii]
MSSAMLRNAVECSTSGRANVLANAVLRHPTSRLAALPQALSPVTRLVSAPQRPRSDLSPQPPLWQRVSLCSRQQRRIAEEVREISEESTADFVDVDALNEAWAIPGAIEFGTGQGDLPTVLLTHPQTGMQLVVYLYGATIAQWLKSDGTATFYDGPDELYEAGLPLRTGVSLHFPQHREGLLPEHGFADSMMWEVVGAGLDCPEVLEQLEGYLNHLTSHGLISEEMLIAAQEGGEAAEAVRAALANEPPPSHVVDTDMAPCITLRLRDTEATRKLWPHKFELLYKITLMTQDVTSEDMRDIRISQGLDPDGDDDEDEDDEDGEDQEGGEGEEGGEPLFVSGRAAAESADIGEAEEEEDGEALASGASPAPRRRGRPRKEGSPDAGAAAAEASGEAAAEEDDEEDEGFDDGDEEGEAVEEPDTVRPEPYLPSVQIKQEFWVRNLDEPGSPPMRFNLASLARFMTLQQPDCSDWVKVLGLGGSQMFDYTADPRYPALDLCEEDYLHYRGQPIDVTYIGAADATVYLCPGNRTHFEFLQRAGFRDMFVQQPALAEAPEYDRVATLGTGYVAATKKLAPGDEWYAQSVIRFHERYWRSPIFGDDSMPPLPPISQELLDEGGDEDEGEGADAYMGLPSDPTGMGSPDREE